MTEEDPMKPFEYHYFSTPDELARTAAEKWLSEIEAANRAGIPHHVALSGGRIAQKFFQAAADLARARGVSWSGVHFFWADERCVPPDDVESNFRIARELLIAPLGVARTQIHRVEGELGPEEAADNADEELRRIVPGNDTGQPVLDLVLLGMGEDGHVASLFPGEPDELRSGPAVYRAVKNSPKPPPNRVTLGYAPIAAAENVWVLISGAGKEEALRQSLDPAGQTPLAHVLRMRSATKIFSNVQVEAPG